MLERTKPLWKPMVASAVKARPKLDRAVKLVMKFRKRYKRPTMTSPAPRGKKMEYTYTPSEGNSISYFTRKAMRIRGFKKRLMRSNPLKLRKTELCENINWAYGRQGTLTVIHNGAAELATIGSGVAGGNFTTQLMLQQTKIHYMITSGSKAAIKLRIYEGCYKQDCASGFTPTTLWQNGMIDTGSTELIGNIDSKPFASVSFMQKCHISKVTNVFIPQGRTHEHYADYRYNKIYNREDSNTGGTEFLQGWTRFTMFVAYGEPIADAVGQTDISTASGRLLVIATKTQRYRYNTPSTYKSFFTETIPVTGISTERLLDEGDGDIETNASL